MAVSNQLSIRSKIDTNVPSPSVHARERWLGRPSNPGTHAQIRCGVALTLGPGGEHCRPRLRQGRPGPHRGARLCAAGLGLGPLRQGRSGTLGSASWPWRGRVSGARPRSGRGPSEAAPWARRLPRAQAAVAVWPTPCAGAATCAGANSTGSAHDRRGSSARLAGQGAAMAGDRAQARPAPARARRVLARAYSSALARVYEQGRSGSRSAPWRPVSGGDDCVRTPWQRRRLEMGRLGFQKP
jgi:hypothetical protein